ncbi:MAG: ATP-dependent RNA helicase HrpA [Desulfobacterales bacterium]|jgi:ATP-dependent helicase HrpA
MAFTSANIGSRIKKIESRLPLVLTADRLDARREINRLKRLESKSAANPKIQQKLDNLEKRLAASSQKRKRRQENIPPLRFNEELPIVSKMDKIIQAIVRHPVIIVSGETGSGKTTQLPKFCLAAGRGIDGLIGCTQPRRIAATTVAHRVSEELGQNLGKAVGYKIRFKDRMSRNAYIKFMTDGILLAETQNDRYLNAYDTIIVDEAHERSLNIDFILGILQTLLVKREDLKLIITSATIDTEKFSKAFDNAPIIEVSGRMYPVEVQFQKPEPEPTENGEFSHVEQAAKTASKLVKQTSSGDILVFMPTEQDIRETCELIETQQPPGTRTLPLFARLSAAEQKRVFGRLPDRKIIVATNVAETSITIPGIKYVIDSGLARISRYTPRTRTTSLPVLPVSKSSADQRKGRCGRIENGICIRLFSEEDYQIRPQFTPPEIVRANLAEVILRMISLKLGDINEFPFIDRPDLKNIKDGYDLLSELGAITQRPRDKDKRPKAKGGRYPRDSRTQSKYRFALTQTGRLMAKIPLDPRLSRMLIEAQQEQCIPEMAVIAAALSIQDPRERPSEKAQEADRMHAIFADPNSDFVTLLNIWSYYHAHWRKVKSNNQMKRFCREHYLSFKRMREWRDIHGQLLDIMKEHDVMDTPPRLTFRDKNYDLDPQSSLYQAIHKSILSGFLSNIAEKKEKNIYRAGKGREVMIFPGSGLFNRSDTWIVAAEVVETSRVFARTVANIHSDWLEDLGKELCTYSYLNPHWERKRGEVVASEQVALFGLIIVSERKVSYGKVNPAEATDLFIQSALINQDVKRPFGFMKHNQRLIDGIVDIENRFRRKDILVSEQELFQFYKQRLSEISDIRSLTRYLKQKGDDRFLRMNREDLIRYDPDKAELAQFPDRINFGGHSLECSYDFNPGKEDDGVTVRIPSTLASSVPSDAMDWLIPGLLPEKIEALIKGLPKSYRKKLVPVKDTVEIICKEMPKTQASLISVLGEFIYKRFGVDIPAAVWPEENLPDYLRMRISVTSADGKEIRSGRNRAILYQDSADSAVSDEFESLRGKWEKSEITDWNFGDLPEVIAETGKNRAKLIAYPALVKDPDTKKSVDLRLFHNREKALSAHVQGVLALFCVFLSKDLKFLKRHLKLPQKKSYLADYFGGAGPFEKRLYDRVVHLLFSKNIRTQKAFYKHAEKMAPKIHSLSTLLLESTIPVLSAYHDVRSHLYKLQASKQDHPPIAGVFQELIEELIRLVPVNFLDLYEMDRFGHLERYIRALKVRAQRAMVDFEKDKAKAMEIKTYTDGLNNLLNQLALSTSPEKRKAIEAYFWMVEEYKVSIFAQELKTAVPVSAKRLQQKLKQIERMR